MSANDRDRSHHSRGKMGHQPRTLPRGKSQILGERCAVAGLLIFIGQRAFFVCSKKKPLRFLQRNGTTLDIS
jgi:hypothetical protein